MPVISSAHNDRYRSVLALRDSRERRRRGLSLIDGLREIERALDAGVRPVEAWIDPTRAEAGPAGGIVDRLRERGVPIVEAEGRLVDRLSYGEREVGLIVVAEARRMELGELRLPAEPLIGVIEGVEKPGNLGAIMRSADGAGLSALIVADPGTDLFNPNVIRASLGTVFSLPVAVASTGDVLAWLAERNIRIVAARVDATMDYSDVDLTGPLVIALGSEARGLSDAWAELAFASVRIPMFGVADSLNVSATAAVLFYEALRQRRARLPG